MDAAEAEPLPKHGEIGRGRDRDGNTISKHQKDSSYLARRLARDDPDTFGFFGLTLAVVVVGFASVMNLLAFQSKSKESTSMPSRVCRYRRRPRRL